MKKSLFCLAILVSLTVFTGAAEAKTYLRLSTGTPGATFYPMGGAMAAVLNKDPAYNVTAEATSGAAENVRRLDAGDTDLAFANSSEIYWGWNQEEFFADKQYRNMGVLCQVWTNVYHWVVLERSGITDLKSIAGKSVTVGVQGSGAALHGETVLRTLGLWDKVTINWQPPTAAAPALMDGHIDVFGCFAGAPMPAVMEMQAQHDIVLLDAPAAAGPSGFQEKYPFNQVVDLPANTYKGQGKPLPMYAQATYLIARRDLPDATVRFILETMFTPENLEYMRKAHARAAELDINKGPLGMTEEMLHPAALAYYKEKGILK